MPSPLTSCPPVHPNSTRSSTSGDTSGSTPCRTSALVTSARLAMAQRARRHLRSMQRRPTRLSAFWQCGYCTMRRLAELDDAARERALARYNLLRLRPHLEERRPLGSVVERAGIPLRTAQRWVSEYRRIGLAGLARWPRADRGGHRVTREELSKDQRTSTQSDCLSGTVYTSLGRCQLPRSRSRHSCSRSSCCHALKQISCKSMRRHPGERADTNALRRL